MEVVLTFVKNYFVLMLIFYLLSYLTPKETYQKYFHFFVSVLVITVLAQPLLVYVGGMKKEEARQQLHEIVEQMESIEYQEKGENILNSILGKWIKKRNKSDFVVLILLGVMVMIVAMPTGAKQSQKETQTQEQKEQQLQTEDSYKEQLQQQLKELLEHMDGVGKTRVMLTFSDEGTDQLDKNVTKDGNKKEETTVVYDTGDTRQPYVICRQMPKIEGVVVVAQGGGNAKTVTEISNAVMSLFPVEAHKVVVVKMSVQEE